MDEIDRSAAQAEVTLAAYIENVRRRAGTDPRPTGFCFNCGESVRGRVFCDSECREDYEKRQNIHRKTTS